MMWCMLSTAEEKSHFIMTHHQKYTHFMLNGYHKQILYREKEGRVYLLLIKGRVTEGLCFKLHTYDQFNFMDLYQKPEILRTPLETICLKARNLNITSLPLSEHLRW